MTSRFRTLLQGVGVAGTATVLALVPLAAQQHPMEREAGGDVFIDAAGAENVTTFNASAARRARGFRLFAAADAAGVGANLPGNFSFATDNYSPCDAPLSGFCNWVLHPSRNPAASTFQFFEVLWFAGAPPSQWAKIRQVAPEVANASGGGYTALMNFALFAGRAEWGPRDGTLGKLFAGETSTGDGSCRDFEGFTGGFFPSGLPLLAASNCPPTWPGGVWGGDRTAPLESYFQLWQAQGPDFAFDHWRVPDDLKRSEPFAGTGLSSYGETSDHYQEILGGYGSAIPGGSGDPGFQGYPLGLVWRFEMFSFGIPSLSGVAYYRATLINRSEDVYGTGVDYDSLYAGLAPGTGGAGAGGMQRYSNYYLPGISTAIYHQSNDQARRGAASPPCSDASRIPTGAVSCAAGPFGYQNGGNAIIVLKSPIGDLRNKLFSRTAAGTDCAVGVDPFCDPSHPLAGDTITFNHGHMCGFGGCWASTHNVNDKRSFGMIASIESNVIDGETLEPSSFTFRTFRNIGYPSVLGKFNKYVPGVQGPPADPWDWNKDGQPDTLYYDSCGPSGCVVLDSDTLPGGHINAYGNVGGVVSAGPFSLGAGDTTSFFFAFVGDKDSASTWAQINAAIDFYSPSFFLGPTAPPPASIVSTQVVPATDAEGNLAERVTLFFSEDPEKWTDPFLSKLADDIDAAPAGTPLADLAAANPGLAATIRTRAVDNLERIEVYKSCDGGATFTSDGDCIGDPASDEQGNPVGFGWEAFAILDVDASGGDVPNAFTDGAVQGGRTFLYVLIGKSRGASFVLDVPGEGPQVVEFAPTIRNALSRSTSDPNVASVYIPASNQAGFQAAQVSFTQQGAGSTAPFALAFSDNVVPGAYRVVFGNQIVLERDSLISTDEVVQTRVQVHHVVDASPGGTPTVVRTDEFLRAGADVLPTAGEPDDVSTATIGDTVRTTTTFDALGFAVADAGGRPFFASTNLEGAAATPTSVFALADFPGFTVAADNRVAGAFNPAAEQVLRGPNTRQRLRLTDADTLVPAGNATASFVQWRQQESANSAFGTGRYRLTWASEAFGLPNGITLNFTNPAATEAELVAGLASRPAATVGLTDAETAALVGLPQTDLVPVRVPFTVRNTTFDRDVVVAMERRLDNTLLLGGGADTVRVEVPPEEWIPGDVLFFLEDVEQDELDASGDVVLDANGQPSRVTEREVTYTAAVVGCDAPRPPACNPVAALTRGQSGYIPVAAEDAAKWEYYAGFTPRTVFEFDMIAPVAGSDITAITDSALAQIRVVPNPFVVFSTYQSSITDSRLLWTNVPPTGTLRIYTVSGQFVQQISWTPADLQGAGDLFWDLKTREGIDVASGLFIWVLTAPTDPTNPNSTPVRARGKFVVIRGATR